MNVEVVGKFLSTLPEDDDHPYRTGPWRPQTTEWDADDLTVVEGELPRDLDGVYLRNTENPLHPALKLYHPFDGDGMIHIVGFRDGKTFYRNRFIRTDGFAEENAAGGPLWPGLAEPVQIAKRDHGWGARTLMKDASSTDVIVHRGVALTSFYQCGDLYRLDPFTAGTLGKETWNGDFPSAGACRRIPRSTRPPASCCSSTTASRRRTCPTAWSTPTTTWPTTPTFRCPDRDCRTTWRSPGTTPFSTTFRCSGIRRLLQADIHLPGFHRDMPSRFAVIPRRGGPGDIRWFEADPTFVLHFTNAYEDGDEIVLDGFFEGDPSPADEVASLTGDKWQKAFRFLALDRLQSRLHRWRFNLVTGKTREEQLTDTITEFGMINGEVAGGHYRYTYAATGKPGWFLFDGLVKHDLKTGTEEHYSFDDGVYGSETAMAPRVGSSAEDDGYLVTLTTDVNDDASYCLVFDAARVADGPVCKLALPERISSGTHSTWVAGAELRRWHTVDAAAAAVDL